MWNYEYSLDTPKPRHAIWSRYQDCGGWPKWDHGLDHVEVDGQLAVGTTGRLTPKGQAPIPFTVTDVDELATFTDECSMGDLVIRFWHRLTELDGQGTRVTHGVVISGPGAEQMGPKIGPAITADIPASVAELIKLA